jgi:hypothetical protein
MADIFISYSKRDKKAAEALAKALQGHGLKIWWDSSLDAADTYVERINDAIDEARAVIVIWSEAARDSDWVTGEAERGRSQRKLISTFVPRFDPRQLNAPFNVRHAVPVGDVAAILAALRKFGVTPAEPKVGPAMRETSDVPRPSAVTHILGQWRRLPPKWVFASVAGAMFMATIALYSSDARIRIAYEEAVEVGSIVALRAFTKKYPDSRYTTDASNRLAAKIVSEAQLAFDAASKVGTAGAWDRFISTYGDHRSYLDGLVSQAESNAWAKIAQTRLALRDTLANLLDKANAKRAAAESGALELQLLSAGFEEAYGACKEKNTLQCWQNLSTKFASLEKSKPELVYLFDIVRQQIASLSAPQKSKETDCIVPTNASGDSGPWPDAPEVTGKDEFAIDKDEKTSWTMMGSNLRLNLSFDEPVPRAIGMRISLGGHATASYAARLAAMDGDNKILWSKDIQLEKFQEISWDQPLTVSWLALTTLQPGWAEVSELCVLQLAQ